MQEKIYNKGFTLSNRQYATVTLYHNSPSEYTKGMFSGELVFGTNIICYYTDYEEPKQLMQTMATNVVENALKELQQPFFKRKTSNTKIYLEAYTFIAKEIENGVFNY